MTVDDICQKMYGSNERALKFRFTKMMRRAGYYSDRKIFSAYIDDKTKIIHLCFLNKELRHHECSNLQECWEKIIEELENVDT